MHKGLMTSLSLYPMKHLVDLFVPYGSFLETKVLLASMSSMLNSFFFCRKRFFLSFCRRNLWSSHSFL